MKNPSSPLIITQADGHQIDHIGLACHNLQDGVRYFQEKTNIQPQINNAQKGAPFQSANVRIGDSAFLEILGPNPQHKGLHPLKSLLKRFKTPTLWFWYVGTDDFDAVEQTVRDAGRCIERKTEIERDEVEKEEDEDEGEEVDGGVTEYQGYVGASIGPGFWPVYPNIIQWKGGMKEELLKEQTIVPIKEFQIMTNSSAIQTAQEFFRNVGINEKYLQASTDDGDDKSYFSLTLETPKGPITFKDEIESLSNWTVMKTFLKDSFCGI